MRRMPYAEAMDKYGSDKPDLRFGMELIDLNEALGTSEFKVFAEPIATGGRVKALCVPKGADQKVVGDAVKHAFVRAFRVNTLASAALAALSALGALMITAKRRPAATGGADRSSRTGAARTAYPARS